MAQVKLPPLGVQTLDVHGVRFVRLVNVIEWIDDIRLEVESDETTDSASLLLQMESQLAQAGELDDE